MKINVFSVFVYFIAFYGAATLANSGYLESRLSYPLPTNCVAGNTCQLQ